MQLIETDIVKIDSTGCHKKWTQIKQNVSGSLVTNQQKILVGPNTILRAFLVILSQQRM